MKQCPSLLTTALSHNLIMSHHLSFPCSPHVAGSKDAQACNPPKFSFAKSPTSFCLICYTFPPVEQDQRMHKLATPQNSHVQNLLHLLPDLLHLPTCGTGSKEVQAHILKSLRLQNLVMSPHLHETIVRRTQVPFCRGFGQGVQIDYWST